MNLNYSNDRGPRYLRKLQYPLTSMKKTLIFIQIILFFFYFISFTLFYYPFHFFILKQRPSLCREEMILDLPLDHDIKSALTITEIFPREHTVSKLGIDSVARSC